MWSWFLDYPQQLIIKISEKGSNHIRNVNLDKFLHVFRLTMLKFNLVIFLLSFIILNVKTIIIKSK